MTDTELIPKKEELTDILDAIKVTEEQNRRAMTVQLFGLGSVLFAASFVGKFLLDERGHKKEPRSNPEEDKNSRINGD